MKYLVLSKPARDPATRYRVAPLIAALVAKGAEVEWFAKPGAMQQLVILTKAHRYDVVFIQRRLFGLPFLWCLQRRARFLVYDHDDAVFCQPDGRPSRTRANRYRATVSSASLVFAGNRYLQHQAAAYNSKVQVLPTAIDVSGYARAIQSPGPVTLVWIGSRSTARYLESHREVLESVGRQLAAPESGEVTQSLSSGVSSDLSLRLSLKIIADFEFQLDNLKVVNQPWSSATEVAELTSSHIGIAPMVDNAWTRGKCALKVLQYMACGLPVISSALGANQDIVIHEQTGLLVDDEAAWIEAIRRLAESPELRLQFGEAGRSRVLEHYSQSAIIEQTLKLLQPKAD